MYIMARKQKQPITIHSYNTLFPSLSLTVALPIVCSIGTEFAKVIRNDSLLTVKKGSLQRLEVQANKTLFPAVAVETYSQPVTFREMFNKPSKTNDTLIQVHYLNITANTTVVISGLNIISQNTDYHLILHFTCK